MTVAKHMSNIDIKTPKEMILEQNNMDEESEPDVPSNDIHSGISAGVDDTF